MIGSITEEDSPYLELGSGQDPTPMTLSLNRTTSDTNRADNHNHILLARITEMLTAAKANKISDFSITEHVSQFRELRESLQSAPYILTGGFSIV